jgi:membrane fusion protein (multidrug efflux system)
MLRRFLVPSLLALAAIGALSAAGDRQVRMPHGEDATDDAFVRADLTPLSAQVEGQVVKVLVQDHQRVAAGQVIAQIDPAEYEARVQEAEARVQGVHAQLETLKRRGEVARANVTASSAYVDVARAAVERSSREATRQASLSKDGLTSEQEHERASFDAAGTEADLRRRVAEQRRAQVELGLLDAERQQLAADLAVREAELAQAKLKLGYTTITAPADGVVGERQVRVGQLVRPGTQIITLVQVDDIWVTANFKERQLGPLTVGTRVEVVVDAFPERRFTGHVDSIAPASGAQFSLLPPDNATGNFTKIVQRVPVKIALDVPEELKGRLLPGMSAVVARVPGQPVAER